jgi:ADP-heptose:LPS heptosyltransferase
MEIKSDCRFFLGDRPCHLHKLEAVLCDHCSSYEEAPERVLLIKLGAAGDVVRTTPLLFPLKERHPQALIYWLSDFPEFIPSSVDRRFAFNHRNTMVLQATPFNAIYNLDKDLEACALASMLSAPKKYGFHMVNGICHPIDAAAHPKWLTGLSDPLNQANTLSYLQEIFNICGFSYQGEPYILEISDNEQFADLKKDGSVIGLNTGCGARWPSRLWPESYWTTLADKLRSQGFQVVLLGGPAEHEQNHRIAKASGATYLGHFEMSQFINLISACDLVVTGVTLAMHLALGLKKKLVLFNNIFNRNEFELFGRGTIIEPPVDCLGCFKNVCETNCMSLISPGLVCEEVELLLSDNAASLPDMPAFPAAAGIGK